MWNEEKLKEELKLKSDEMLQIQERLKQLEDEKQKLLQDLLRCDGALISLKKMLG
jgi:predicted nuclease with TOPRIM domain